MTALLGAVYTMGMKALGRKGRVNVGMGYLILVTVVACGPAFTSKVTHQCANPWGAVSNHARPCTRLAGDEGREIIPLDYECAATLGCEPAPEWWCCPSAFDQRTW